MTLLSDVGSARRPTTPDRQVSARPPTGRHDRRTLVLVASVALVGASIAAFSSIYAAADHKIPAVVVVRPVARGQAIVSEDLGEADVAVSPGVGYIPLAQAAQVIGKRAMAALPVGTLLSAADLTGAPAIATGDAVVGVALKDGTYPSAGLSPGDQVMVVQTAAPGSSVVAPTVSGATVGGVSITGTPAPDAGVLVPGATVFAVTVPTAGSTGGSSLLVSLELPSVVAAEVATAAAAGQVGLVLLPRDASPGVTSALVGPLARRAPVGGSR